jgi:hypothetical protein
MNTENEKYKRLYAIKLLAEKANNKKLVKRLEKKLLEMKIKQYNKLQGFTNV